MRRRVACTYSRAAEVLLALRVEVAEPRISRAAPPAAGDAPGVSISIRLPAGSRT